MSNKYTEPTVRCIETTESFWRGWNDIVETDYKHMNHSVNWGVFYESVWLVQN